MNVGLYQSVSGMKSMWEDQQIISANLARAEIPGHKASFAAFFNNPKNVQQVNPLNLSNSPTNIESYVDYSQGPLQATNNPLDLAIHGDAYFTVQEKDGSVAYTRNGQFMRDVTGALKLPDGTPVLGEGGAAITIPTSTMEVTFGKDGTIFADGNSVGKVGLARFNNPAVDIAPNASGHFSLQEGKSALAADANTTVEQGFLEKSNTDSIREMVRMMEVMRIYQANQQMIAAQDSATGSMIKAVSNT